MRVMVRFRFPTEVGNASAKSGRMDKMLGMIMEDLKPEAAYFYPTEGMRGGHLIINMDDSTQVLEAAERFWHGMGGEVEMTPVMGADDIQKGFAKMQEIIAKFG